MPNCDFYALAEDVVSVLDFVFSESWTLVELASRHDQKLRSFTSTREVLRAHKELVTLERAAHFHIYAPAMGGRVRERRITFKPGAVAGAKYRYDSEGWGLIQLYFGRLRDGRIEESHTNHNSEKRALKWQASYRNLGRVSDWNWSEVTRMSGRLNRFIRAHAATKKGSRLILPAAHKRLAAGSLTL
jgi:hypothetical protein